MKLMPVTVVKGANDLRARTVVVGNGLLAVTNYNRFGGDEHPTPCVQVLRKDAFCEYNVHSPTEVEVVHRTADLAARAGVSLRFTTPSELHDFMEELEPGSSVCYEPILDLLADLKRSR